MGTKLGKGEFPSGHSEADFKCFGPPATKDGEFDFCKIADLGCFSQDGVDSNKYYHGAICQSKKNSNWYVYFEWGRTGRNTADKQFIACSSEADAQSEFKKQLMAKNVKRGTWVTIGGIKTLQAKPGEDSCYLVRSLTTRNVGLPDGRTIQVNEGAKKVVIAAATSSSSSSSRKIDHQTISLMRDLSVATVAYTRGAMASDVLPTQSAIDEARIYLTEAQKRVKIVGDKVPAQVKDQELRQLTCQLYSRIPKKKELRAEDADWILSSSNIMAWEQDLDAFESALYASSMTVTQEADPFGGMAIDMEWVDPKSDIGKFIYGWWPNGSGNRHSGVGNMKIRNIWFVKRHADAGKISRWQDKVLADKVAISDRPFYQPHVRLDTDDAKRFKDTNTALMFHGTRTVNVNGILRESWRLPKQLVGVSMNGAAFGPGTYWADDWRKSDGYTSRSGSYYSRGSGGINSRGAFMFAADVVLGNPWICPGAGGYTAPKPGPRGEKTHHIFAKMNTSGVYNNEFITFDANQCAMRYLCEYDTK